MAYTVVHVELSMKGENPNNGDLPLYVVVDFPLYHGSAWDTKNPTVLSYQEVNWMGEMSGYPIFPHSIFGLTHSLLPVQSAYPNTNKHLCMSKKWRVLHPDKPPTYPGLCKNNSQIPAKDSQQAQ